MSGRGLPSWYKYRAYGPVYEEIRLAEHAVRLGSPVSFDRRGDVLFLDSFEQGLNKWMTYTTHAGAAVTPYSLITRSGGLSVRLDSAPTIGSLTGVGRSTPLSVLSKLGFEHSLRFPDEYCYDIVYLYVYTGSKVYYAELRYCTQTLTMSYKDATNTWVDLSPIQRYMSGGVNFSTLKLVIDGVAGEYVRAIFNGKTWNMAGIAVREAVSVSAPGTYTSVLLSPVLAESVVAILDDTIITQNEP